MVQKPKHIAMILYALYSTDARVKNYVDVLLRSGWDVDILSLGEPAISVPHPRLHIHHLGKKYQGESTLGYIASYVRFAIAASARLALLQLRHRYQVIHVHNMPDFLVFTAILPGLLGARIILDLHDTMPELYMAKFGVSKHHVLYRALVLEERLSALMAGVVIATNDLHREIFIGHGIRSSKIRVVMNVANPTFFRTASPVSARKSQEYRFIYHGTIAHRLGLDIALRAFRVALDQLPFIRFMVIGEGEALRGVLDLSKELALENEVSFTGRFLPVEELPSNIEAADAGVISNRSDPATDYMLPVKLLEYVYMQKPCIASRTPAIEHYFDDSMVLFFPPGDVGRLAEAMVTLGKDRSLGFRVAQRANAFNASHSWASQEEVYRGILDSLAHGD